MLATQGREGRKRHPQRGFQTLGLLLVPPREPQELMQELLLEPLLGPLLGPLLEPQERQQEPQKLQEQQRVQQLAKRELLLEGLPQPLRKLVREW